MFHEPALAHDHLYQPGADDGQDYHRDQHLDEGEAPTEGARHRTHGVLSGSTRTGSVRTRTAVSGGSTSLPVGVTTTVTCRETVEMLVTVVQRLWGNTPADTVVQLEPDDDHVERDHPEAFHLLGERGGPVGGGAAHPGRLRPLEHELAEDHRPERQDHEGDQDLHHGKAGGGPKGSDHGRIRTSPADVITTRRV